MSFNYLCNINKKRIKIMKILRIKLSKHSGLFDAMLYSRNNIKGDIIKYIFIKRGYKYSYFDIYYFEYK